MPVHITKTEAHAWKGEGNDAAKAEGEVVSPKDAVALVRSARKKYVFKP